MSLSKLLFVICILAFGFRATAKWRERQGLAHAKTSADGFVWSVAPNELPSRKVLILAPANCPREAGRRADALERTLAREGVPYTRLDHCTFPQHDAAQEAILNSVMQQAPIVFISNYGKSRPEPDEVVHEFNRTFGTSASKQVGSAVR